MHIYIYIHIYYTGIRTITAHLWEQHHRLNLFFVLFFLFFFSDRDQDNDYSFVGTALPPEPPGTHKGHIKNTLGTH